MSNLWINIHLKNLKEPIKDYYPDEAQAKKAISKIEDDYRGGAEAITTLSGRVTFARSDFITATVC